MALPCSGELALDGSITSVAGALPAAMAAYEREHGLICPAACGSEAAWAGSDIEILAPRSLIQLANHFKGTQVMARPEPAIMPASKTLPDLRDIKGQESAKRTLKYRGGWIAQSPEVKIDNNHRDNCLIYGRDWR